MGHDHQTPVERRRAIFALGLPIVGAMVSQNVLNLVDTAMVGRLGDASLAAVGIGSFANFMATAMIMGLSGGVQAMVARRKGAGRESDLAVPLNGALLLAVAVAVPLSLSLFFVAHHLFPWLHQDPEVVSIGTHYFQARVLSMTAVGMNYAFRGYWNAVGKSSVYLGTLLVMHVVNIGLNCILIYGYLGLPAFGALGAGIASCISTYVGTLTYALLGLRFARKASFLAGLPDSLTLKTMLRIAIPTCFQQLSFSAGLLTLFWIIGLLGTRETAAAQVVTNLTLVLILPALAFGLASASLVGQALGRKDASDARRWGWEVVQLAVLLIGSIGLLMCAFPEPVLCIFLKDPQTLAVARGPLRIYGVTIIIDAVGLVLQNALIGAGAAAFVMRTSILTQWFVFLPLAYLVGPVLGWGLVAIWCAQMFYRSLGAFIYAWEWQYGRWSEIRV